MDLKAWYLEQRKAVERKRELEKAHPVLRRLRPWLIHGYVVFLAIGLPALVLNAMYFPSHQVLWLVLFLAVYCIWLGAMTVYEMLSDHLYKVERETNHATLSLFLLSRD